MIEIAVHWTSSRN